MLNIDKVRLEKLEDNLNILSGKVAKMQRELDSLIVMGKELRLAIYKLKKDSCYEED